MEPAASAPDASAVVAHPSPAQPFSVVCFSPQPWNVRLPTNRQQIMRSLAERRHDVLFVHTAGFYVRRLVRTGRTRGAVPSHWRIHHQKPRNLAPWGRKYALPHRLNSRLGAGPIAEAAAALPRPLVAWVYDPCAVPLARRIGADLLVYDCVDDYAEQVGGDRRRRELVRSCERELVFRADLVFATATPLYERHREANANTFLVRNVGDFRHFARADRAPRPDELRAVRTPVVGFAGNFLANKVDLDLIAAAARARTDWTFVLIGPGGTEESRVRALAKAPNVVWLGPRSYAELPRYVAAFDVATIPYLSNQYTRSCFPLKLYEYLAAGKPVVASGVSELAGMEPDVVLAADAEEFVAAIDSALARREPADVARRRALAAANSWDTRAGQLADLVGAALAQARP
jgi:glycosyltransferase involved in cell wall biosynthesis